MIKKLIVWIVYFWIISYSFVLMPWDSIIWHWYYIPQILTIILSGITLTEATKNW